MVSGEGVVTAGWWRVWELEVSRGKKCWMSWQSGMKDDQGSNLSGTVRRNMITSLLGMVHDNDDVMFHNVKQIHYHHWICAGKACVLRHGMARDNDDVMFHNFKQIRYRHSICAAKVCDLTLLMVFYKLLPSLVYCNSKLSNLSISLKSRISRIQYFIFCFIILSSSLHIS